MMQYWSATALLYLIFLGLLARCAALGIVDHAAVRHLELYTVGAIVLFYLAVRASHRLHLAPTMLAALQGVFGITCNMWAYSIAGPLRGATLMGLMVVIVFCTFSLRPRQVLLLAFAGLAAEERRESASGHPTCIALLDLDFFKQVNDCHGHAVGDEVLRQFAGEARAELRTRDVLARWGGEEFLLMLPDTELADAQAVLARMRARVARLKVAGAVLERPLSFSGGLTTRQGREPLAATVNRADKALYQAKSGGRDRIVVG
jgi:diguanylate cyclase (GGDEF)-like protein